MKTRKSVRAGSSGSGVIILLGFLFLLPLVWQFIRYLKNTSHPGQKILTKDMTYVNYIMSLLKREGFTETMSKLITAQAGFETGNFTSVIFKENNNLFGMKLPKVRKTTAIGENRGHAVYRTIEDSVKDYWLYSRALGFLSEYSSVVNFIRALVQKKYFEAKPEDYQRGVEIYYNKYFGNE